MSNSYDGMYTQLYKQLYDLEKRVLEGEFSHQIEKFWKEFGKATELKKSYYDPNDDEETLNAKSAAFCRYDHQRCKIIELGTTLARLTVIPCDKCAKTVITCGKCAKEEVQDLRQLNLEEII